MSDRPNWERPLIEQMANIYITQIGELQAEVEKLMRAALEGRIEVATNLQMKCDKLQRDFADAIAEIERLRAENASAQHEIKHLDGQIQTLVNENEELRARLRDLLATKLAEECQECAIGQTPQWKAAKALLVI